MTDPNDNVTTKMESYWRANREVAELLNHTDMITSQLNYLDPRISVAWCKKQKVPIEKVYNETQREKFSWALDSEKEFIF